MKVKTWNHLVDYIHQTPKRWLVLFAAGVLILVIGLVRLAGYAVDFFSSRGTNEKIRQIYYGEPTDAPTPDPDAQAQAIWNTPVPGESETVNAGTTEVPEATEPAEPARTSAPAETSAPVESAPPAATETPVPTQTPVPTEAPATKEPVERLPVTGYPDNPNLQINSRFRQLRKESKYIIGWLNIDKLIDEAVVQRDNTFYLDHDVYGKENVNGAVFLDGAVSLNKRPFAYLLYGHNMKTGEKFGCLRNFENISFYRSSPFISFDTIYESGRYVVFSIGTISLEEGDRNYLDVLSLVYPEVPARQAAIDVLKQVSVHTCTIDVQPQDQFLLLITCVSKDEERRVVAARRVRDGEDEQELKRQASKSKKK